MFPAIKTSCIDHEGSGMVKFQEWDGKGFKSLTPYMAGDRELVRKMVDESAAKYERRKRSHHAIAARKAERDLARPDGGTTAGRAFILRMNPSHAATAIAVAPYLSINNIEVIYGHVILVLKGVSLDVPEGKIVALLGANGAGKTTTLKAISNLLSAERGQVTKGTIELKGQRIDRLTPHQLVKMGVCQVMEGRHCFAHLSVEENLLTGAFTRSVSRADIRADLERVYHYFPRLKQRRTSQAGYTSGGEQQMTAVGRALMARPSMILLAPSRTPTWRCASPTTDTSWRTVAW